LIAAARQLQDDLLSPSMPSPSADTPLDAARAAAAGMKKTALMILGLAMQTYGARLADEQEVLTRAADVIIDTYAAESAVLRASAAGGSLHEAAASVFVNDAAGRVELLARDALAAMVEGDMLRTTLAALRRVMKVTPVNTVALRRRVADAVAERRMYPF
jgi:hypothetical protein